MSAYALNYVALPRPRRSDGARRTRAARGHAFLEGTKGVPRKVGLNIGRDEG